MALRKLVTADLSHHRVRAALTVTSIALAVSLVVSVTSGYASLESAVYKYLGQYMGTVDVEVYRANDAAAGTSEKLLEDIQADPDVRRADGRYETSGVLTAPNAEGEPRVAVIGVDRPGDTRSDYLNLEPGTSGGWFDTNNADVAVIDQAVAANLHVSVGDEFTLPAGDEALKLKVVGIVHKPEMLAQFMQTIYVPLKTLQRFTGKERMVSRVMIDLKPGVNVDAFAERWRPRLREVDPNLKIRLAREARKEMSKNLEGIHALSYMGGTVSMLAAAFIVFSALSMGVSERQRTLAMLRAVGAQRSQVAGLVVIEALMLALFGAALGVPLGWLWINVLAQWFHEYFFAGVTASWGGILFGSLGSILTALLASIMPALWATRIDPLEAMNPHADPPAQGPPLRPFLIALAMLAVDPFLMFGPIEPIVRSMGVADPLATTRMFTFYAHFAVGLPLLLIGFFLIAPMFVWIIERLAGPFAAPMFGLRPALLRQQLSTGIWRVAGVCAALMIGLAVLVVLQTNGNTMISGWRLPDKFPDIFVMSTNPLRGLNQDQVQLLESVPGIRKGEVLPIGIASPEYGSKFASIAMAAVMPNATMFLGVDPDRAFKMMGLEFREGNPEQATALLKQGDHLVITEEFRQLKNLHVGSTFPLRTNQGDHDFTVAAVVWSPGIEVMVSTYDMNRQFDQRTAASVFGSLADGRKYFGINDVYLFAANLEPGWERPEFVKQLEKTLGKTGMKAGDVRQIKAAIQSGLRRVLLLITTVAFAAMAVSSLGVTNTILASIRSRRWQFGVLRSIGISRSQLLRLILAEAFLIGLIGSVLGLAAGALMTLDANALSHVVTGYRPPVAVPWGIIAIGTLIVMTIAIAASLGPAISVSRAQPLELLQAGRGAT